VELELALTRDDKYKHLLLVESGAEEITRAILAKLMKNKEETPTTLHCQFIGPVQFRLPPKGENWMKRVRIGDTQGMAEIEGEAWNYVNGIATAKGSTSTKNKEDAVKSEKAQVGLGKAADSDVQGSGKWRALLYKDNEVVKLLLKKGTDMNIQNSEGQMEVLLVVANETDGIAKLLLKKGAILDIKDSVRGRDGNPVIYGIVRKHKSL
jgi:hypothetical protein